jgi:hypothetical protein
VTVAFAPLRPSTGSPLLARLLPARAWVFYVVVAVLVLVVVPLGNLVVPPTRVTV